jgi:hypothetical protein
MHTLKAGTTQLLKLSMSDVIHVVDEMVNVVNAFSNLPDSMHDGYPISARPDRNDIHHDGE